MHSDNGNPGVKSAKFTVTSDGSAAFAGKVTTASTEDSDSGDTVVTKDYLGSAGTGGDGSLGYWTRTGTTLSPVNNGDNLDGIGRAVFAGSVTSGTQSGATGGCYMQATGGIFSKRPDGTGAGIPVFQGGTVSNPDNISLNTNGSAEFRGDVSVNNDQVKLDYRGEISVKRGPTNTVWRGMNAGDSDTVTSEILGNGTATFTGNATAKNVLARCEDDAEYALAVRNAADSAWTAYVKGDGSAQFVGQVDSGALSTGNGCRLNSNGVVEVRNDAGSGSAFSVLTGGAASSNIVVRIDADGSAKFTGTVTENATITRSVVIEIEPDNDANYTTTTEEYTDTEYYTVEVPVVERPGTGTADIQDGVGTADLVDGDERQTQTITKSREVTKTREVKTYTGPTLDVKEKLLAYEERFKQQDAVIAQMTTLLKGLGADVSTLPALEGVTKKKKR